MQVLRLFRGRLAKIMQRDHEVWVGGLRYVRLDQVEEAIRYAESQQPEVPPPAAGEGRDQGSTPAPES